jgi:phospholipase/carboxylesterase
MQKAGKIPPRSGAKPRTTLTNPHQQVEQNAPPAMQEALLQRARGLPGVLVRPSQISVEGARAFWLPKELASGPPEALMTGEEFAHLHPPYDGSLHMKLPFDCIEEVLAKGWGELHPSAPKGFAPGKTVMVFGPRAETELDVVWQILHVSYAFATG